MKLFITMCIPLLIAACQSQTKDIRLVVFAKTQSLEPIAGADVYVSDRLIGKTNNLGIFETQHSFVLKKNEVIKVAKNSKLHKFQDAYFQVTDNALNHPKKRLIINAALKIKSPKKPQAFVDLKSEFYKEEISTKPVIKNNPLEVEFRLGKQALEQKQPHAALKHLTQITLNADGSRNYKLGKYYGAHINEALAHYYLGVEYLSERQKKQAEKEFVIAIKILDQTLAQIKKAPADIQLFLIMEAEFNKAMATQKLFAEVGLASYKMRAYQAWRDVFKTLATARGEGDRSNQIKKYAIQNMKSLEKQIL